MLPLLAIDLQTDVKLRPDGPGVGQVFPTIASFLNLLVPMAFVIAGVILLFLLIGGGFSILASGGNAKSVEGGKNQITTAVIGFFIIFAAYWIVQIIGIITGLPMFKFPGQQ